MWLRRYEQKAKDRQDYGDEYVDGKAEASVRDLPEFRPADPNAAGPAGSKRSFLRSRDVPMKLEKDAGQSRILSEPEVQKKATGWYCDVCDCLLRDSASYLDHINGKKHQRKLGFSMRVERVGVEAVRERFALKAQERHQRQAEHKRRSTVEFTEDWEARLEKAQQAQDEERQAKREHKRRQRDILAQGDQQAGDDAEEHSEMNALMGFGSFGGSKKTR